MGRQFLSICLLIVGLFMVFSTIEVQAQDLDGVETLYLTRRVSRSDLSLPGELRGPIPDGSIVRFTTDDKGSYGVKKTCVILDDHVEMTTSKHGKSSSEFSSNEFGIEYKKRAALARDLINFGNILKANSGLFNMVYDDFLDAYILDNLESELREDKQLDLYKNMMKKIDKICGK